MLSFTRSWLDLTSFLNILFGEKKILLEKNRENNATSQAQQIE